MNVKRFKLDFKALLLVAAQKSQHDTKCEPRGLASALLNQQLRSEVIDGRSTIWGAGYNAEKQAVVLSSRPGSPEGRYDLAAQDVLIPFEALNEVVVEIPCEITGEGPMFEPVDVRWHEVPAPLKTAKKDELWAALGERDARIAELEVKVGQETDEVEAMTILLNACIEQNESHVNEIVRLRELVACYEAILTIKGEGDGNGTDLGVNEADSSGTGKEAEGASKKDAGDQGDSEKTPEPEVKEEAPAGADV